MSDRLLLNSPFQNTRILNTAEKQPSQPYENWNVINLWDNKFIFSFCGRLICENIVNNKQCFVISLHLIESYVFSLYKFSCLLKSERRISLAICSHALGDKTLIIISLNCPQGQVIVSLETESWFPDNDRQRGVNLYSIMTLEGQIGDFYYRRAI